MGKGYNNYMTKKFFHPSSKENIKRVWMAQQKHAHDKQKQEDLLNQYQREQEMYSNRALLGDEKAQLGLSFMYDPPPGLKKKEKEDDEPEFKFEWQRKFNAPREAYAKDDETIRDQPFGIEVRNVRCIKCRKWGHVNTDKICPLFFEDLTAEPPQPGQSTEQLADSYQEEGFMLKQSILSRLMNSGAANEKLVGSEDEDDPEVKFLKSLTPKQKKKLLKKLDKMQKGKSSEKKGKKKHKHKHRKGSSDSDQDVKGKSRKSKKSKRRIERESSESSSDSQSDSESDGEEFQRKRERSRSGGQHHDDRHRRDMTLSHPGSSHNNARRDPQGRQSVEKYGKHRRNSSSNETRERGRDERYAEETARDKKQRRDSVEKSRRQGRDSSSFENPRQSRKDSVEIPRRKRRDSSSVEKSRKQQRDSSSVEKSRRQRRDSSSVEKSRRQRRDSSSVEKPRRQRRDSSSVEKPRRQQRDSSSVEKPRRQRRDSDSSIDRGVKQARQDRRQREKRRRDSDSSDSEHDMSRKINSYAKNQQKYKPRRSPQSSPARNWTFKV
ncbi:corepressor interacting with RBPJ 1-like [Liolophura sinensis]|uniref:corepressor interacting with RBPJ 1-like n=1 Tax=Liolophura sinensis TaxID=3198878 RepID=UPI003158EEAC